MKVSHVQGCVRGKLSTQSIHGMAPREHLPETDLQRLEEEFRRVRRSTSEA